jgi:hypothetical protein
MPRSLSSALRKQFNHQGTRPARGIEEQPERVRRRAPCRRHYGISTFGRSRTTPATKRALPTR